jgi:HAD superfamily hydrolase (TIGR01549 family)
VAAIIFDFDGTIADTIDYFIDFIAREAKIDHISEERRQSLHGLPLAAISRRLGHRWWRLPLLYYKGRRVMEPYLKDLKPFQGMPELIEKLHAEGHELFIISSNTVRNMRIFLRHHKLQESFLEIYGGIVVFGKAPALRKLLKEQNIEKGNAIYIGDELRDVQSAQSLKLRVVAVTWGFARPESLRALKPTAVADTPAELMSILENI